MRLSLASLVLGFFGLGFLSFRVSFRRSSGKGIPLNEGEVGVRKEERGVIIGSSLRLSLGFSGCGFLWAKQSRNPPLWQRQRKETSSCGNCGKTRSGVVRVIEVLEIVGVVDSGNYLRKTGGGAGEGAAPPPQCKSNIDSAGLLRFLIGVIRCQSSR